MKVRVRTKFLARYTDQLAAAEDALAALYDGMEPDRPIEAYVADPRLRDVAARALERSRWRAMGLE